MVERVLKRSLNGEMWRVEPESYNSMVRSFFLYPSCTSAVISSSLSEVSPPVVFSGVVQSGSSHVAASSPTAEKRSSSSYVGNRALSMSSEDSERVSKPGAELFVVTELSVSKSDSSSMAKTPSLSESESAAAFADPLVARVAPADWFLSGSGHCALKCSRELQFQHGGRGLPAPLPPRFPPLKLLPLPHPRNDGSVTPIASSTPLDLVLT
jgi:hypothetical protein